MILMITIKLYIFQSTLPRGERPIQILIFRRLYGISIHAPTRGATILFPDNDRRGSDFNPRSHEGSDCLPERNASSGSISIHAPTRGATKNGLEAVKGFFDFNPRSHEGSDEHTREFRVIWHISIHAPTRGATAIFAKKFSFLSAKIV